MTEAEWSVCKQPLDMLDALRESVRLSERKARLFVAACCRRDWPLMPAEGSRRAVEAAERYADGVAGERDLRAAVAGAWKACCRASHRDPHHDPAWAAYALAYPAGLPELPARMWGGGCWGDLSTPEREAHARLLRCVVGNPYRPAASPPARWAPQLVALARAAYEHRHLPSGELDQARLLVLADALEDAGVADTALLAHLRGPGPHVRGCFALDLLLGKR
jgi:hypothetical protein